MTIIELREKRNKAWEAAKAFVETKRDNDGLLSAEDAASYAEMEQKIKDYGAEIERMEQMAAMDAQLSKPTSAPLTAKPLNGDKPKSGRASDEYKGGDAERSPHEFQTGVRCTFPRALTLTAVSRSRGVRQPPYRAHAPRKISCESWVHPSPPAASTKQHCRDKPAAAWIDEGGALTFGDATFSQITLTRTSCTLRLR